MNSWTAVPLGHVANLLSGGTPSKAQADYWNGTIPWLTPKDMRTEFVNKTEDSVTEAAIGNGTRLAPRDALFIAVRGMSLHNEIRIVRTDRAMAFNQDIKAIIPQGIDGRFLFLALSNLRAQFLASVESAGHGTGRLPTDRLESTLVPFPPPAEQRAIAEVLGAMDDKIEVNRRMSETLEEIARAIFKSWFVDFDPVRAKMEGRDPGLAPDIAALFPDRVVETDDGRVPEGWRWWCLEDLAVQHRATLSPANDPERIYEHYSIPAYDNGQEPFLDRGNTIQSNKTIIPDGAVLLSKLNPEINRVWLTKDQDDHPRIASTEFLCFTPREPAGRALLYCAFRIERFRRKLEGMVTGTSKSHQRVSPEAVLRLRICPARGEVFKVFEAHTRPLLDRTLACREESRTLAALRDLLLPKLMSGEIRIKDAEKLVGEAGA